MRVRSWDKPDQPLLSQQEYIELFPHDIYQDEKQPSQLPKQGLVHSFAFDTIEETAVVFFPTR